NASAFSINYQPSTINFPPGGNAMARRFIASGLFLSLTLSAAADVVVLQDGRRFTGEVTPNAEGYLVKTQFGLVQVTKEEFAQLITTPAVGSPAKPSITPPAVIPP